LGKRNCDAYSTLREAVLVADNGGFDTHLQHHHTVRGEGTAGWRGREGGREGY
jgi:hypothetical protein